MKVPCTFCQLSMVEISVVSMATWSAHTSAVLLTASPESTSKEAVSKVRALLAASFQACGIHEEVEMCAPVG